MAPLCPFSVPCPARQTGIRHEVIPGAEFVVAPDALTDSVGARAFDALVELMRHPVGGRQERLGLARGPAVAASREDILAYPKQAAALDPEPSPVLKRIKVLEASAPPGIP